jgi:SAM-dependent methyltransferase
MAVLDVGCGTGAITAGIVKAVGPGGCVIGIDRDPGLLDAARGDHEHVPNLRFVRGDATSLPFRARFDIVAAARTLQWISEPLRAVIAMKEAARPGGRIVVLDYNHNANSLRPAPPAAFRHFYQAFLGWRRAHGWDNDMADHLPELLRAAGLTGVTSHVQDDVTDRQDPEFAGKTAIWSHVIDNVGAQIVAAGFLTEGEYRDASRVYTQWRQTDLVEQRLSMRGVTATVPLPA